MLSLNTALSYTIPENKPPSPSVGICRLFPLLSDDYDDDSDDHQLLQWIWHPFLFFIIINLWWIPSSSIFWLAFVLRFSRETELKGCVCIGTCLFIIRHCSHDHGGWEAPGLALGRLETQESWCWLSSSPGWRPESQESRRRSSTQKPQAWDPRWANISIQVQSTGNTDVPAQGSQAEGVPLTHRRVSLLCCSGLPLNEPTSGRVKGFPQSPDSNINPIQKHPHRHHRIVFD